MKRIFTLLIIVAAGIILLAGCKKKENPINIPETLSMSVSGDTKTATNITAAYSQGFNTLTIKANFSDGSKLSLQVSNPSVSSFEVSTNALAVNYTSTVPNTDVFIANSGTLNITLMADGALQGNFEFAAFDSNQKTDQITAGTFSTTYTTHY
jgi:hypothetical protein